MIITIDGPAGTGKSTIAERVAHTLGYLKLDTGALYRAVSAGCLVFGINPEDWTELKAFMEKCPLEVDLKAASLRYFIGTKEVTDLLRSHEVTSIVSFVASCPHVREALLPIQQNIGKTHDLVAEGRDMGTTVFPHANHKFYLTATPKVRALRRYQELAQKGQLTQEMTPEVIQSQIEKRDSIDSKREASPLKKAFDAIEIDTSDLSIDEVVEKIVAVLTSLS